jgi:hypothetical protein
MNMVIEMAGSRKRESRNEAISAAASCYNSHEIRMAAEGGEAECERVISNGGSYVKK